MNLIIVKRPRLSPAEKAQVEREIQEARENAKYTASLYAEIYHDAPMDWDLVEEIIFFENLPEGADGMDLSDY